MLILSKLKEMRKNNKRFKRLSKFNHINHERYGIIFALTGLMSFIIITVMLINGLIVHAGITVLLFILLCLYLRSNKNIKRLGYLNKIQLDHVIRHSYGLEMLKINKNYKVFYKEIIMLNDSNRIDEIPNDVLIEMISVYNKNEKISNKEIINCLIKDEVTNGNYVEIINTW